MTMALVAASTAAAGAAAFLDAAGLDLAIAFLAGTFFAAGFAFGGILEVWQRHGLVQLPHSVGDRGRQLAHGSMAVTGPVTVPGTVPVAPVTPLES